MEKSKAMKINEKLANKPQNTYFAAKADVDKAYKFCEDYKIFLDSGKTERKATGYAIELAEKAGFIEFNREKSYKSGDKIYLNNRGKACIFAVLGKDMAAGANIVAAHIDSPRLDLKPNPLYEDTNLALFKTHYYGGIKKYQWTSVPLALHGTIIKQNGESVEIEIGEDANDPILMITDLLPHLAKEQSKRTLDEGIKGEELNVLLGLAPLEEGTEDDAKSLKLVKLNILKILNDKYGIVEKDFIRAELSLVPAGKSRDLGLDRSMIGGYGQDDRVCSYPSLIATLECKNPAKTAVCVLADKEETGSDGNTGLNSVFMRNFLYDLAKIAKVDNYAYVASCKCLSADVEATYDPTFPEVNDKMNCAYLGRGVCLTKYTGARGKSHTSDASAEYMAHVMKVFDDAKIIYHTGQLGKVDMGGGGTVAMFIANLGIDVVDVGVPTLSMHAPMEVCAKVDIYQMYKAITAFYLS